MASKINVVTIGPYHFLALSQKFLKSVYMIDCIPISINIIFFLLTSLISKKKLTSDAVRKLFDEMAKNTDNKKATCSVFLDLKKAFDTVNHKILLLKLESYGICGLPHQLLKSYLSNRQQYMTINGVKSNLLPITCGIPQESILGPFYFWFM